MNRFQLRQFAAVLFATGLLTLSSHVYASGFQLFEQDAATIGNYHAGYAAASYDASTAFYNPAGIVRFNNQQVVLAADSVLTNFKYTGTIGVNTILVGAPQPVTAQGGGYNMVPALHYVTPLGDVVWFGLSVDVPFGLKTNYGKQTILRYAATETSIRVIDISPVLAFKLNDQWSFGIGPDIQIAKGEFNQVATLGGAELDSDGFNTAEDTGYGMHAGVLYQPNQQTRVGLSYHSQSVHHLIGTSSFTGPLAADFPPVQSSRAKLNLTLPPYTALSAYHYVHPQLAVMGSVIYTQWNTIQNLVLQNVAGLMFADPSTSIVVTIPQHFHNTFNYSVGADYFLNDKVTLRGGLGYDETPASNAYRNVQMPDNNRFAIAVGAHYQSTKTIGLDVGWTHLMMHQAHVAPPPQVTGDEIATTNGSVNGGADVLAVQLVWDIV